MWPRCYEIKKTKQNTSNYQLKSKAQIVDTFGKEAFLHNYFPELGQTTQSEYLQRGSDFPAETPYLGLHSSFVTPQQPA